MAVSIAWSRAAPDLRSMAVFVGVAIGSFATGRVARVSSVRGWIVAVALTVAVEVGAGLVLVFAFLAS
jgi:hypothetical protein